MEEKETFIADAINSADSKAQYDEHVRRILKDKNILAFILKYSVREFMDYSLEEAKACIDGEPEVATRHVSPDAVHALENESNIPGEGRIYFDIVFYVRMKDGNRQRMYINIEAQKSFYPGYDLVTRGIIYPARLLSQQMDVEYTADNYDGVKKVYSIWICMNTPDKKRSYKKVADSIVEYSIKPTILYPHDGTFDTISTGRYDLMSTVFINLNANTTTTSKNTLISMLSTLLSDNIKPDEKKAILENDYGIPMSVELEGEVNSMCNLSDAVEERGIELGIERGIEQGINQIKISQIVKKVKKNKSLATIADELEEDIADIEPLYNAVINAAPDYDEKMIYDSITQ